MLLTFLKYAGYLIAAVSSVWGITTDVSKDVDGKKKLTRGGYISIIFVAFGFLISVASAIIEDRQNAIEQESKVQEEIRRTNRIILAGQPITSLKFDWIFDVVDKPVLQMLSNGDSIATHEIMDYQQGGVRGPSQNGPVFRTNSLYPFIKSLIKNTGDNIPEQFLLLIALDNNQNTILPIGYLKDSVQFIGRKLASEFNDSMKFPVGVETVNGNAASFEGHGNSEYNFPEIAYSKNSVSIHWNLDPVTFLNSFNSQFTRINPSANFPDTLKIALLFDFDNLPFTSTNFALSPEYPIWEYEPDIEPVEPVDTSRIQKKLLLKSSLHFTPNNLTDQTVTYTFMRYFAQNVFEKETGEAIPCKSIVLYYVRAEKKTR